MEGIVSEDVAIISVGGIGGGMEIDPIQKK